MDEPTVGIDPQSRSHILETVQRLNREDVTVLYTSHYMEEVEYLCSRIAIMDHGAIIAEGTLEELRSTVGDTDSVELTLSDAPGSLAEEIAGLPGVLQAKKVDSTITTLVKDGHERVAAILETVYRAGVKVRSIQIVEPNLESVFLKLTGRALRD